MRICLLSILIHYTENVSKVRKTDTTFFIAEKTQSKGNSAMKSRKIDTLWLLSIIVQL